MNRCLPALLSAMLLVTPATAEADREADRLYEEAVRRHASSTPMRRFERYARAAEAGHPAAQYNVAMMYANGEAVNVDYQQSVYWFTKSAGQQFAPSQYRLGELYWFGMGGLPADPRAATRLFEAAAAQGDPDACLNLAIVLASGDALRTDAGRARAMLDCAGDGGNEWAGLYRAELDASPDGRFDAETQKTFWQRQRQYWVEMAAAIGVREAEEAVSGRNPDP
jgi:TPR repeat protein